MTQPHFGIANIAISGDMEKGLTFVTEAQSLLRITLEQMRVRNIQQLSAQRRFSDDTYCYVVCAGGYNMVRIVSGYGPAAKPAQRLKLKFPVGVPDFVSGAVVNGTIISVPATVDRPKFDTLSTFHPTLGTSVMMGLPYAFQAIERLAVLPYPSFDSLGGDNFQGKFSQYRKLKPTMYSGTMKQVVQMLMGFGKQRVIGDRETSVYDQAPPKLTSDVSAKAISQYQKDVQDNGLQIRYDWRFSRTHGITYAGDGKPWLIEIGITQGVLAMPLPLHVATTTPEFRAKLESLGDVEGLAVLDTLGGFPTGEVFPSQQVEAWVKSGHVLRLCAPHELDAFYGCSPYGSSMGWAFNERGDEAHNTAYYYDDQDVMHGVHYMVPLGIGAMRALNASPLVVRYRGIFETLRGDTDYKDRVDPVDAKLDLMSDDHLAEMDRIYKERNNGLRAAFDYADQTEVVPIATGSAHLSRVSDGYLFTKAKVGNLIKFPEDTLGLLVSVDMQAVSPQAALLSAGRRCDTTVHVFFRGNEMKWVKFYREPDGYGADGGSTSDNEPCMFIGSWSSHTDSGRRAVTQALYTNDFDDRAELSAGQSTTVIKGIDMGYSDITAADDITAPYRGAVSRRKRFMMTTTTDSIIGEGIDTGVAVPFYDREAYYYASMKTNTGTTHSVSYSYKYLTDPYSCNYWRNFPGYMGSWGGEGTADSPWYLRRGVQHPNGCGPVTDRTVWDGGSGAPVYSPSTCGDIADGGPWCFVCDNVDGMVYSIPEPALPASVNTGTLGNGVLQVWLVSGSNIGTIQTFKNDNAGSFGEWELQSPLGDPQISSNQYIEETHNAMGDASVMRFEVNINGASQIRGGPIWPGIESGTLTYIGVVNG